MSTFFQAMDTCSSHSAFDVPRTPLENRFLLAQVRRAGVKQIWINLNSLKASNCWTVGNANCPYGDSVPPLLASFLLFSSFPLGPSCRCDGSLR